jgi:hypothetical protein
MTTAIGTKIKLVQDVDNSPTCLIGAGETGTLVNIDHEGSYWVKLDKYHPELAEWDNAIQISDWSDINDGQYHPETYIAAAL